MSDPGVPPDDVTMPRLSDSMEEATVLRWLKHPGETVAKGEPLVEVETDKATIVYEAERAGVLAEIVVDEGQSAALGAVIARLASLGGGTATPQLPTLPAPPTAAPSQPPRLRASPSTTPAPPATPPGARARRHRATPVARRLAAELDLSLEGVRGSGPGGRIVRSDVRRAAGDGARMRPAAQEVALTPTQRTIAERMTRSRAEIPEFTLEVEIDMEPAALLRAELKDAEHEPLPSFNDLVVRAAALALREFPALNASYREGKVLRFERVNVGVAVDAGDALLVPTIFDADRKSVFAIADEARRLAERIRSRSIAPGELADATFTVSNLGMLGVRRFTAVINPPQAAILAVGSVAPRPVVEERGGLVARHTMDVALSCDHRAVYGAEAARFLQRLRALLEHPVLLVLEPKE